MLVKITEEDGQDVDAEKDYNQTSIRSLTDITTSISQSLNETFPLNIPLDAESLEPDGN